MYNHKFSNGDISDFVWTLLDSCDREAGGNSICIECLPDDKVTIQYILNNGKTSNMGVFRIFEEKDIYSAYRNIDKHKKHSAKKFSLKEKIKYVLNDIKERFLLALEVFIWKDLSDWRHS